MVKVKVCGLTREEDFRLAENLGVDYAGFIFHPASRRHVEPERARAIIAAGSGRAIPVGVFVDAAAEQIRQVAAYTGIAVAQLHGGEGPELCRRLSLPSWKTFWPGDAAFLQQVASFPCQVCLLDSRSPSAPGGTGESFDWRWAAKAIATGRRIAVAGGVSSATLAALLRLQPFAVDVCSALEEFPGKKSGEKMRHFFGVLRGSASRSGK